LFPLTSSAIIKSINFKENGLAIFDDDTIASLGLGLLGPVGDVLESQSAGESEEISKLIQTGAGGLILTATGGIAPSKVSDGMRKALGAIFTMSENGPVDEREFRGIVRSLGIRKDELIPLRKFLTEINGMEDSLRNKAIRQIPRIAKLPPLPIKEVMNLIKSGGTDVLDIPKINAGKVANVTKEALRGSVDGAGTSKLGGVEEAGEKIGKEILEETAEEGGGFFSRMLGAVKGGGKKGAMILGGLALLNQMFGGDDEKEEEVPIVEEKVDPVLDALKNTKKAAGPKRGSRGSSRTERALRELEKISKDLR